MIYGQNHDTQQCDPGFCPQAKEAATRASNHQLNSSALSVLSATWVLKTFNCNSFYPKNIRSWVVRSSCLSFWIYRLKQSSIYWQIWWLARAVIIMGELPKYSKFSELFPVEEEGPSWAGISSQPMSLQQSSCSGSIKHETSDVQTRLPCHYYPSAAGGCHLPNPALSLLVSPLQALKAQISGSLSFAAPWLFPMKDKNIHDME